MGFGEMKTDHFSAFMKLMFGGDGQNPGDLEKQEKTLGI